MKLKSILVASVMATSLMGVTTAHADAAPAPSVQSSKDGETAVLIMLLGIGVALMASGGGLMMGSKSPSQDADALRALIEAK